MKLLFFTGELNKNLNATNKIAFQLAEELSAKGHRIFLIGANYNSYYFKEINKNFTLESVTPEDIFAASRKKLEKYIKSRNGERAVLVKRFALSHPFSAFCVNCSYSDRYKGLQQLCLTKIESLYKAENFDYIVCFQEPSWSERVMMECSIPDCKKVIYQTDPYGMHQLVSEKQRAEFRKNELENFKRVKHIFTTAFLKKEYQYDTEYNIFSDKITAVEFPNIRKITNTTDYNPGFDKNNINIVFCGLMDDSYRSPRTFLNAVCPYLTPDIKFHFWGDITSKSVFEFQRKYPENIIINQRVDSRTAVAIQLNADFLLNIGNSVSNQVPSKIFDYFSIGKPIINIQKIKNCPAQIYMDRYPLAYTFRDFSQNTEDFFSFLKLNKGEIIDFSIIREMYIDATPEYVAAQIENVLSRQ